MQGARVPSLVRELRSHTPDGISSVQSRMANHFSILVLPWGPHEQCERPSGTAKIKKKGLENWCIFLFPWSKFFSETRWINCLYMSLVGRINQDIWVRANIFFASFFLEGGSEKFFFSSFIIYFWLCWVFNAMSGLSLVAPSRNHSSSRCVGFSLQWPVSSQSTASRHTGLQLHLVGSAAAAWGC